MANELLHNAKNEKKSEFWTRYEDIEKEMNAYHEFNKDVFKNKTILCPCDDPAKSEFTRYFIARAKDLGIKRIICTSYAGSYLTQNPLDEEKILPCFDSEKHYSHGRIYDMKVNEQFPENAMGLNWDYLDGDGDFRSEEVTRLRNDSDIIITNGPFALFREFLAWIMEADKQFIIIGNQNAITYKEVFPLIKDNKIWLGNGFKGNVGFFKSPYEDTASAGEHREGMIRVSGVMWFTNIDHGKRHEPLQLMTMEDNLKYNKKLRKKLEKDYGKLEYPHYDNYDAIEIPFTEAIPSDYDGVMGVPITFLDKYCPEQFELLNANDFRINIDKTRQDNIWPPQAFVNGKKKFFRLFIRNRITCTRS